MKAPQVVLFATDDWLGNQVREVAADHRWLFRESHQLGAFAKQFEERRPSLAVVSFDAGALRPELAETIASLAAEHPELAIVAVSEAKITEDHRPAWTAALLDLGCRWVLYPPLTPAALGDVLGGCIAALAARMKWPAVEKAIDLAAGGYEEGP